MDPITLSRIQFGLTTIYHFFFVPITIGLSLFVAIIETLYVRTGNETYKKMAKFWGKLFTINFAMGVVTGLVQEFQFGMNWSEYSRFVGGIFGVPLAIETLLAFFLESVFIGLWHFSWDRISKKLHAMSIWLVAIATVLSAFWILMANQFMQYPVGYVIEDGKLVMTDFMALITNRNFSLQFLHTVSSALASGMLLVFAVSAYHLWRKNEVEGFQKSYKLATWIGLAAVIFLGLIGHQQALAIMDTNPMKMIASESHWETSAPASLSLFTIADQENKRNIVDIRIPYGLSLLVNLNFTGEVVGINQLQADYEARFGPGDYIPPINVTNYAFRIMVGVGLLLLLLLFYSGVQIIRKKPLEKMFLFKFFPLAAILPYLSNSSGWILTEMGRQPWVVFGLLKTVDGVSNQTITTLLISLIGFTVVYGGLLVVDVYLLVKFAKLGPRDENVDNLVTEEETGE
ncbi:MAG: cytochrome ubiquinol oxidase subunit I [Chloroflexi bacterium]|nr:cytochrome ubiquinol oxidase subunit I [Chloroflexota bacterium]